LERPPLHLYLGPIAGPDLALGIVSRAITAGCSLATPVFLGELLKYINPQDNSKLLIPNGYVIAVLIVFSQLLYIVSNNWLQCVQRDLGLKLSNIVSGAVYEKSFRLSSSSRAQFNQGRILNLINNDSRKVAMSFVVLTALIEPIRLVLSLYLLWSFVGLSFTIAIGLVIVCLGFTSAMGNPISGKFAFYGQKSDQRVTLIGEVLKGIRHVKSRCLEPFFESKLFAIRSAELKALRDIKLLFFGSEGAIMVLMPVMLTSVLYTYASWSNGSIYASTIFPAIALMQGLMGPLDTMRVVVILLSDGRASIDRMSEFLLAEENLEKEDTFSKGEHAISTSMATWRWKGNAHGNQESFEVSNVNLSIPHRAKVAIVGSIGQGKSTLISGLVGDLELASGELIKCGTTAYVPQEPWFMSGTIKDNILFGEQLEEARLDKVVRHSGLEADLLLFSDGVDTNIGENGVTLSGGQKARVSLARALYRNSDIYILDCPLAALDAKVSKAVFERGILESLQGKTILMATHKLSLIQSFDYVIVLDDGKVIQFGTTKTLMEREGPLKSLLSNSVKEDSVHSEEIPEERVASANEHDKGNESDDHEVIEEEERKSGSVSLQTYIRVVQTFGVSLLIVTVILTFLVLVGRVAPSYWLYVWLGAGEESVTNWQRYMTVYVFLNAGFAVVQLLQFLAIIFAGLASVSVFHKFALKGVLRAPLQFFDANPIGRILNRFSTDIQSIDFGASNVVQSITSTVISIVSAFVLIAVSSPFMLLLVFVIVPFCLFYFKKFKPTNLGLKRWAAIQRGPLNEYVSGSISGVSTINAYRMTKECISRQQTLLDEAQAADYQFKSLGYWLNFRMSLISTIITFAIALLGAFSRDVSAAAAAGIGLALTSSSDLSSNIINLLTVFGQLEAEVF
jgi:ABC-type multidrug transport system fused ATPase/permease subunit